MQDLSSLNIVPDWSELAKSASDDPDALLVSGSEIGKQVLDVDLSFLRVVELKNLEHVFENPLNNLVAAGTYPCDIEIEEGKVCKFVAKSYSSLVHFKIFKPKF